MLYAIALVIFILWLIGFLAHIGGSLIHLLLILALIVLVYRLVTGNRAAS